MSNAPVRQPPLPLIVAITASGTLSLHILLPALPAIAADLQASPATAQLALTLYLIGLAFGQLFYGPLSDRFGRRPMLIGGLTLYLAGTLGSMLAPGILTLLAARVFQALGGCSGQVLGRAMLRDAGGDVVKRIAILSTCMAIAPAFAPGVGGFIAGSLGWRWIFGALALIGGGLLLLTIWRLPETNHRRLPLAGIGDTVGGFGALLRIPAYRGYAVGGALGSTNVYAYLAAAPFVFSTLLHRPAHEVGAYLLMQVACVGTGTFISSRLAGRINPQRVVAVGCAFQVAAGTLLLALLLGGLLSVTAIVVPMLLFGLGTGLIYPGGMALALAAADERRIGAASALYGFLQMGLGAVLTVAVGFAGTASATPMAAILLASAIVAGAFIRLGARNRHAA